MERQEAKRCCRLVTGRGGQKSRECRRNRPDEHAGRSQGLEIEDAILWHVVYRNVALLRSPERLKARPLCLGVVIRC
jgi:hypothetical protein